MALRISSGEDRHCYDPMVSGFEDTLPSTTKAHNMWDIIMCMQVEPCCAPSFRASGRHGKHTPLKSFPAAHVRMMWSSGLRLGKGPHQLEFEPSMQIICVIAYLACLAGAQG